MVKTLVTGSLRMKGKSGKGRKIEKTQVFRKGVVLGRSAIGSLRPWNERVRIERERERGRGTLCLSILLVSLLFCIMLVSFLPVWLQETTFSLNRRADTLLLFIYLPSKFTGGSLKPINSWSHSMQTTVALQLQNQRVGASWSFLLSNWYHCLMVLPWGAVFLFCASIHSSHSLPSTCTCSPSLSVRSAPSIPV